MLKCTRLTLTCDFSWYVDKATNPLQNVIYLYQIVLAGQGGRDCSCDLATLKLMMFLKFPSPQKSLDTRNLEENLNRSNFSWLEQLAKIVFLINAFSHRESWHLVQCLNSQLSRLESVAMPEFCLRNFISGEIAHLSVQYKCKLS